MVGRREPREVIVLTRAARALAEATDIEDIAKIRDTAQAAQAYVRSARLGLELQNQAAEIRLRAERKLGKILTELHLQGGNRRSKSTQSILKLDDLGISNDQSARWQKLSSVSEEVFCQYIHTANDTGLELTGAGLMRWATRHEEIEKETGRSKRGVSLPASHGGSGQPSETEGSTAEHRSPELSDECGMQCVFSRPATIEEVAEIVAELKNHRDVLADLLAPVQRGKPEELKQGDGRAIGRLLSEVEALLVRMERMLVVTR